MCLGQANSRIFAVPPALGIDHRVLYGWVYMSANPVSDPAEIGRRAEVFGRRAGYYFQNWDELYGRWRSKVEETIAELVALEVPALPDLEDEAVVTEGRGVDATHALLIAYNRLLESVDRIWQYHFEFLNLGYAAYLVFYEFCKQNFPDIPDQTIAKMVGGIDILLFRPDDEVKGARAARARAGYRGRGPDAPRTRRRSPTGSPQCAAAKNGSPRRGGRRSRGSGSRPAPATATTTARGSTILPSLRRASAATSRSFRRARRSTVRWPGQQPSASGSSPSTRPACRSGRDREAFEQVLELARNRVSVRREPQLLRRALAPLDLLEQGARARRDARRRTASWTTPRTSSSCTATRSTTRSSTCCTAWATAGRGAAPATGRRCGARGKEIMAKLRDWSRLRPRSDAAGSGHRAADGDALGRHDGHGRPVARRAGRLGERRASTS